MIIRVLTIVSVMAISLFGACKNEPKTTAHAGANPFDTTHFETQALTDADRERLLKAQGKVARPIDLEYLAQQINAAKDKLHIYCFWNLKTPQSVETVKSLNKLSAKYDSTQVNITFVTMPGFNSVDEVNLFIREQQLTDATLIAEKADVSFFAKKIRKDMVGITTLPVILLVNKTNETLLFFNKPMDEKELTAMIAPLL
jgi:hypothetical protein